MSRLLSLATICVLGLPASAAEPMLPEKNATVSIAAQEWLLKPGPRTVAVGVYYPGGKLSSVTAKTGVMLSLHNWGGSGPVGTADPQQLADRYDVIALTVDYLQSGKKASIDDPEPYDFGYLQALDAIRAVHFVQSQLDAAKLPFARGRVFACGGSGGGNVALMANKLAPRTFACVVDLCGMAKLTDDIAFNLPGGSDLDARYRRDPKHPFYLSPDAQALRFVGNPDHLKAMKALGNRCRVVTVHGVDDTTCPFADKKEMADNMTAAGLTVEPVWVTKAMIDGKVYASTGHSLGNRTQIVIRVADQYLKPGGLVREGKSDSELRDGKVRYATANGVWVIDYTGGVPVGMFEGK